MDVNLEFIRRGNTGCVFATYLSRNPEKIGWKRIINPSELIIPPDAYIVSLIFEGKDQEYVKDWALRNGMYEDITSSNTTGLRFKNDSGVSWVQYFGPDAHVKTRRAPNAELLFCVRLPLKYYPKVAFKGVLHLAHASIEGMAKKTCDMFWNKSFSRTKSIIGHAPTINEAAKTTFKNG